MPSPPPHSNRKTPPPSPPGVIVPPPLPQADHKSRIHPTPALPLHLHHHAPTHASHSASSGCDGGGASPSRPFALNLHSLISPLRCFKVRFSFLALYLLLFSFLKMQMMIIGMVRLWIFFFLQTHLPPPPPTPLPRSPEATRSSSGAAAPLMLFNTTSSVYRDGNPPCVGQRQGKRATETHMSYS